MTGTEDNTPSVTEKVRELISENEVLLFMKGTPDAPQCGFSMRVVGILDQLGADYAALDVLPALEPLRDATGEIGDWRTFPQLWVKGSLVGGCDIVEEMNSSGELASLLGVKATSASSGQPETAASADSGPYSSGPIQIEEQ